MIDIADGNTFYYHFDGLGSVIALSNNNKEIVERYSYDVFGGPNTTGSLGNPYLFTARRYDPEAGLYYYRARYYAYDIGRFLQPDPLGYDDGMNIYTYVDNNPLNFYDPRGMCKGVLKSMWDLWYSGLHNFGYQWGVGVENALQDQAAFRQRWNERRMGRYHAIYGQSSFPSFAEQSQAYMYESGHAVLGNAYMMEYALTATINRLLEPVSQLSMVEGMPDIHIPPAPPFPGIYISGDTIKFVGQAADSINAAYAIPLAEHERQVYDAWKWHWAQEWQYGKMQYSGPKF